MRTAKVRFSPRMNAWFYGVFGILFFSGVMWLIVHYFGPEQEFVETHPLGPWLLRIHGAAAMAALVVLGVLIPTHIRTGWSQKRNQSVALVLITLCVLMVISGYGLYYCGDDVFRSWISGFHNTAGCLMPVILLWHIINERKSRKRA